MSWLEIVNAISNLGVLIVIAGFFLYFYARDRETHIGSEHDRDKWIQNTFDLLMKKLISINPHILHELTDEESTKFSLIERDIDEYIEKLRLATKSSSVQLVRFHNGGYDSAGNPFLRMSVTNEVITEGFSPIAPMVNGMFRYHSAYIIKCLDKDDYLLIPDVETIKKIDYTTYKFLITQGITSVYYTSIKNNRGVNIGFLAVTFVGKNYPDSVDNIKKCLADKRSKIGILLNIENSKK